MPLLGGAINLCLLPLAQVTLKIKHHTKIVRIRVGLVDFEQDDCQVVVAYTPLTDEPHSKISGSFNPTSTSISQTTHAQSHMVCSQPCGSTSRMLLQKAILIELLCKSLQIISVVTFSLLL
jgi:hypothetical protein